MSITAFLVIFLVVCMAVGPVLMLQPSRRQRNLASLRLEATSLGLKVRMQRVSEQELAVYSVPWPSDAKRKYKGPDVYLKKVDYQHGLHLMGFWEVQPQPLADQAIINLLNDLIPLLPESVVGVELNPAGIGLHWLETGGPEALAAIAKSLNTFSPKLWSVQSEQKLQPETQ